MFNHITDALVISVKIQVWINNKLTSSVGNMSTVLELDYDRCNRPFQSTCISLLIHFTVITKAKAKFYNFLKMWISVYLYFLGKLIFTELWISIYRYYQLDHHSSQKLWIPFNKYHQRENHFSQRQRIPILGYYVREKHFFAKTVHVDLQIIFTRTVKIDLQMTK